MKIGKMLKLEFRKMFVSWGFLISAIIGLTLAVCQSVGFYFNAYVGQKANYDLAASGGKYSGQIYPTVMLQGWMGQDYASVFQTLFYLLLPVIAVLPYGASLYQELSSGYLKNVYTRISRGSYLACKYVAAFIGGGTCVAAPLLLSLLISALYLPNLPQNVFMLQATLRNTSLWVDIYFGAPHLYALLFILLAFIFGGLMAVLAIGISQFANNVFTVWLFPFLLNTCAYYFLQGMESIKYVPMSFLNPIQNQDADGTAIIVTGIILFAVSLILFILNAGKKVIV